MLEPRSELAQAPLLGDAASHGITIWTAPADGSRAGGDWCEVVEISEDVTALTIGDVAGHGDDAAEVMRAVRGSVLHPLRFMRDPSDVLAAANAFIANRTDEPIVTAIVAYYNRARRTLSYANAGHPPPLLIGRNSASYLRAIRADIPLGVYARHCAQVYTISVPAQTLVVLYTDGVTERERDPIRGRARTRGCGDPRLRPFRRRLRANDRGVCVCVGTRTRRCRPDGPRYGGSERSPGTYVRR